MGRYIYFNTRFQYKFAFAIQSTADILDYGINYDYDYQGYHEWSENDKELILCDLEKYKKLGYDIPNFDDYEKNVNGTSKLYSYNVSCNGIVNKDDEVMYRILLACIIYHQLLYCPKLTAKHDI